MEDQMELEWRKKRIGTKKVKTTAINQKGY